MVSQSALLLGLVLLALASCSEVAQDEHSSAAAMLSLTVLDERQYWMNYQLSPQHIVHPQHLINKILHRSFFTTIILKLYNEIHNFTFGFMC